MKSGLSGKGKCSATAVHEHFYYRNSSNALRRSVKKTIEKRTLDVVYQPIVNHSTNAVFAHEALSRPQFEGKPIPPDIWFQAAYETDRSVEADLLALSAGVGSFTFASTPLFLNVMPSSLSQQSFLDGLERLLGDGLCQPEQLVLEVTEHVSYTPLCLSSMVNAIRSIGVRIALDDVGTGSANLSALITLEPDFIKVDRSLIQGVSASSSKQRLLSLLVGYMGGGNSVIAEGVETVEDLLAIKEAGAHLSQGYYWAHPMPAESLSS